MTALDPALPDPLAIARALVARGLSVIPIPRPRPGVPSGAPGDGKVPALPWRAYQTRIPTDAELVAWFSGAPQNVAIVTGAVSAVVAIDLDSPAALAWGTSRLPWTPWQTKTSRGYHLFYRHPGSPVLNRARLETPHGRLAVDVRGDGGFVIAPGSVHASGATYQWAGDWAVPRDQLPRFWPGWLAKPGRVAAPERRLPRPTGDVVERARRYLAAIPRPEIGNGSDEATWYAACRVVRGFGLSTSEATALLWDWCGNRSGWTYDWVAQKVQHAERAGTEPIGALR